MSDDPEARIKIRIAADLIEDVLSRLVLDSLPGRQMAIDADLASGCLSEHEATIAREHIRHGADLLKTIHHLLEAAYCYPHKL